MRKFWAPTFDLMCERNHEHTGIIKVVGSLDLSSTLRYSLGGFEIGQFNLDSFAQAATRADQDVRGFEVQVDTASPLNVVQGIKHLQGNFSNQLFRVHGPFSQV